MKLMLVEWTARAFVWLVAFLIGYPLFKLELELISNSSGGNNPNTGQIQEQDSPTWSRSRTISRENNLTSRVFSSKTLMCEHKDAALMMRCHSAFGRLRSAMRLFFYLTAFRALTFLYLVHFKLALFDKGTRPVPTRWPNSTSQGQLLLAYTCLKSDCWSLLDPEHNESGSESRIMILPHFALCYPRLADLNEPWQHQYGTGSLIFAADFMYSLMIYLMISSLQALNPTRQSMLFFLLAPNLARELVKERAKQILADLRISYGNYLESVEIRKRGRLDFLSAMLPMLPSHHASPAIRSSSQSSGVCKSHVDSFRRWWPSSEPSASMALQMASQTPETDQEERLLASGSLPIIRSKWWHRKLLMACFKMNASFAPSPLSTTLVFLFYMDSVVVHKRQQLVELASEMAQANCSLWRHEDTFTALGPLVKVDLTQVELNWNAYTLFSAIFVAIIWMSICACVAISESFLATWELRLWICSLNYKLTTLLPFIRNWMEYILVVDKTGGDEAEEHTQLQSASSAPHGALSGNTRPSSKQIEELFSLDHLNLKFTQEVSSLMLVIHHKPFNNLEQQLSGQRFMMRHYGALMRTPQSARPGEPLEDPYAPLVELLKKLYVEFRLMCELKDEIVQSMSAITLVCIAMNYCITLFAIYVIRATKKLSGESIAIIGCSFYMPILLILNSALLHARAAKLCPQVRSLVSEIAPAKSQEVKHLHQVWVKLVEKLESRGAPSLRFDRLSVCFTYVNLIQIIVWTATLLVCVLRF